MISFLVNKALSCDEDASKKLLSLDKKILGIKLLPMEIYFYVQVEQQKINIFSDRPDEESHTPDAMIEGTPLNLIAAFCGNASAAHFAMEDIAITGDVLFVQALKNIFQSLDGDWQEKLARLTNDNFAYFCSGVFHKTRKYAKSSLQYLARDLKEYLEDEKRVIVSKDEVDDFCADVDKLSHAFDRLHARWMNL